MEKYLRDEQHYIDLYDLHTIEQCLDWLSRIRSRLEEKGRSKEFEKYSKEEFEKETNKTLGLFIHSIKLNRFKLRSGIIQKWKSQDGKRQELYDNTAPPRGIVCVNCSSPTKMIFKDLTDIHPEKHKVFFMFECLKCKKRQGLYEDGSKWHSDPEKCLECRSLIKTKFKSSKNFLTIDSFCTQCSYKNKEVSDFKKMEKERKEREARNRKLLADHREAFCFTDTDGINYLARHEQLIAILNGYEERKKKEADPLFQKAKTLKKLTLAQVGASLEDPLIKGGYKDLRFGKPEMDKYVIVDFSVTDGKEGRSEYQSQGGLKKLIKMVFEETNWRLMSEGVNYRLGILTGRIKAYEREDDLIELVKSID